MNFVALIPNTKRKDVCLHWFTVNVTSGCVDKITQKEILPQAVIATNSKLTNKTNIHAGLGKAKGLISTIFLLYLEYCCVYSVSSSFHKFQSWINVYIYIYSTDMNMWPKSHKILSIQHSDPTIMRPPHTHVLYKNHTTHMYLPPRCQYVEHCRLCC